MKFTPLWWDSFFYDEGKDVLYVLFLETFQILLNPSSVFISFIRFVIHFDPDNGDSILMICIYYTQRITT